MDDEIGIGTYNGVYLIDRRSYQQKQLLEGWKFIAYLKVLKKIYGLVPVCMDYIG